MTLQLGFSFIAGVLTTLSPCVLPILPFLLGSATRKNKKAPLFMVLGLATSFVVVGFTLSRFGSVLGLDSDQIKTGSAILLILSSLFFLSKKLQEFVGTKLAGFASMGSQASSNLNLDESSNIGSVFIGALLGVVWSPCIGPTLGVAVSLASQDGQSTGALITMLVYALGAVIPMLAIAYGLQAYIVKNKNKIFNIAENSKLFFGIILFAVGVFILTGLDKVLETYLLSILPEAWVDLITKF